jgi:proteasome activator subunit 4
MLMRYPMQKPMRAKLVTLYYELCLLPGIEARVTRNWADMLTRLIDAKPGARRKLERADLCLPWRPLWRALARELWPKKRAQDGSRNVVNILLYVAEHCRRYYDAADIGVMLETFLPLVTQDVSLPSSLFFLWRA